ncbi:MAG: DUF503 domain-containing protein [Planctomycetes bacterium]|nr:DUF503 domain-containing protein [Planctomycetota bacterium]
MFVGMMRIEMRVMGSRSLKEKRRPLKSMLAKLQNKFECAVAEVDYHDKHQRAAIGLSVVASDASHAQNRLDSIREFIEYNPDCMVLDIKQEIVTGPAPFGHLGLSGEDY